MDSKISVEPPRISVKDRELPHSSSCFQLSPSRMKKYTVFGKYRSTGES